MGGFVFFFSEMGFGVEIGCFYVFFLIGDFRFRWLIFFFRLSSVFVDE